MSKVLFGAITALFRFRSIVPTVEKQSQNRAQSPEPEPEPAEKETDSSAPFRSRPPTPSDMSLARLWHTSLANQQPLVLTVNTLKNVLFYYLAVKYTLKSWRHLVAHGPVQTVVDGWRWLSLVRSFFSISTLSPLHGVCSRSKASFSLCACRPPEQK